MRPLAQQFSKYLAGYPVIRALVAPLLMAGCLLSGCSKSGDQPAGAKSGNPITAPVDYIGAAGQAQKKSMKTLDEAGLNQSIQMFYAQEGRYPKDLNELVNPNYLTKLPTPPVGMKFDYNPTIGQVKVVPK
jgi:hypothetical protein